MSLALGSARGTVLAALRWHRRQLQERPVLTNSLTSCMLMFIGDRLAQRLERERAEEEERAAAAAAAGSAGCHDAAAATPTTAAAVPYDARRSWTRTTILCTWSLLLSSPFWVRYYRWLAFKWPNRQMLWVAATAVVAIPFNTAFFSYGALMSHVASHPAPFSAAGRADAAAAVATKLDDRLVSTLVSSTQLWPVVNWAMFTFVPLEFRNLFSSVFALGWNTYLSLQHGAHPATGEQLVTTDVALGVDGGGGAAAATAPTPPPGGSFTAHVVRQVVEGYEGSMLLQPLWGLLRRGGTEAGGDAAGGRAPAAPTAAAATETSAQKPAR